MANITKSAERIVAENEIYDILDAFDKSKYNSDQYRKLFNSMTEQDFKAYMKQLSTEEQYISIDVDTAEKELTIDKIFKICDKINIKSHKYVLYKENVSDDGAQSITPHPALILYIPVKRLQQLLSKKNSASGNTDKINPMTGAVTSDSKSASLNDTQSLGLVTTDQLNTLRELHGPRSDDQKSKFQMLHAIEEKGEVYLRDLNIDSKNKQSLATLMTFLKGVAIDVKLQ